MSANTLLVLGRSENIVNDKTTIGIRIRIVKKHDEFELNIPNRLNSHAGCSPLHRNLNLLLQ